MGLFDPLRVNQPVELELPEYDKDCYRSRVEGIFGNKITLAAPLKGGQVVSLSPGTAVKVIYKDEMAIYTFISHVISQECLNPPTVTLGEPYDKQRIQRRNFVRLDANLTIVFSKVDENLEPVGEVCWGNTVDISGGGVMFACSAVLKCGDVLYTTVHFSDNDSVKALGKVVRFVENPSTAKFKYSVGLEFTIIEELERDKIIKFIFNRQRELRKKGLL